MTWTILFLLGLFVLSFSLGLITVPIVRNYAFEKKILDCPGRHKNHVEQIPLLGGVAIWFGLILSVIFALGTVLVFSKWSLLKIFPANLYFWATEISTGLPQIIAIIVGSSAVALLGLWDDLKKNGLHYLTKFLVQFLAAGMLVASGVHLHVLPWPWLNVVISFLWIIGITNAFNLLDGMDGLASGVAAISALGFLVLTNLQLPIYASFFLVAIIGSSIGFLRYNFFPSKIFMGDAGSLLLGFLLGSVAIISLNATHTGIPSFFFPLFVLGIPIYDTLSVIIIRLRQASHLFVGDQNHFFHRLARKNSSKRLTVIIIYFLNTVAAFAGYMVLRLNWLGCLMVVVLTVAFYTLLPRLIRSYGRTIRAPATTNLIHEPESFVLLGQEKKMVSEIADE